ncbi:phospholipid-transporting ATPase, partial [Acrasis kona]
KLPWNRIPDTPRRIRTNEPEVNKIKENRFCHNAVSTGKYNVFTFIPQNLIEQFTRLANVYFLIISCLQLFSGLSPTGRVGTVIPLVLVVIFQMIKDGFEDLKRHIADRQVNKSKTTVLRNDVLLQILWEDLKVGDIVQVEQDQPFPADLVCLSSTEAGGLCYIETSNLDGETNLKIRRALHATSQMAVSDFFSLKSTIVCQQPNNQIYKFNGTICLDQDETKLLPIEMEQILLRGSVLKNTRSIFGVVIYTGRHTKLMMNSQDAPRKVSKVEKVTNIAILALFGLEVFVTILCAFGIGIWQTVHIKSWYVFTGNYDSAPIVGLKGVITFFILFNNFIPISLYVSMEFAKLLQARYLIDQDIEMYYEPADTPAVAKTSSLNEELGQVEHIFSDKTGTLTQNIMEFLKFSVDGVEYGRGTTEIGRAAAKRNGIDLHDDRPADWVSQVPGSNFYDERILDGAWKNESCHEHIHQFLTLLSVCHTVIPETDRNDPTKIVYQAASPDEGALVIGAAGLDFKFVHRTPTTCTIQVLSNKQVYQVLNIIEFNSTRKRMSVIVKTPDQKIVLMTKGADNVILPLLKPNQKHLPQTLQNLKKFAEEGLRTLLCAQVELDPVRYEEWNNKEFIPANTSLVDKEEAIGKAALSIERDLDLVGATAIEDKLQDGVPNVISELSKAGIKMWVLTGDKQETAINIGYACALLDNDMHKIILNQTDRSKLKTEVKNQLRLAETNGYSGIGGLAVVIDGASLEMVLQKRDVNKVRAIKTEIKAAHEENVIQDDQPIKDLHDLKMGLDAEGEEPLMITFLRLCLHCKSVICCRVSPLQKSLVVKMVRKHLKGSIGLAIGDGANDVSMIQAAHIGVGISGQEGLQAARASDYSIAQFRYLQRLLLVHGRYNYRRIVKLICYCFYKNLTAQLCQFWFVWFNAFTGISIYDSLLLTLFNIIFTALPIIVFAVLDRDVSLRTSMEVPRIYVYGQKSHYYNMRVFFGWILTAVWHSLCCFFVPFLALMVANLMGNRPGEYSHLQYMVYTCVVIVCTLKVGVESASWTIIHHLTFWGSILSWFIIVVLYAAVWPAVDKVIPQSSPPGIIDIRYQFRSAYFEYYNTAGNWVYWFVIMLAVVMAMLKDIVWKAVVHNVRIGGVLHQEVYHVAQVLERSKNSGVDEKELKQHCTHGMFAKLTPPERSVRTGMINLPFKNSVGRGVVNLEKEALVKDLTDVNTDTESDGTMVSARKSKKIKSPNVVLQPDTTLEMNDM